MIELRTVVLTVAFGLAAATCSLAQNVPKKPAPAESAKPETKLVLTDAVRVSTNEALASAAQREAKKSTADQKPKESHSDAVTEFHAVDPDATGSHDAAVVTKEKSSARQIHGEVRGGVGSVGSQESGKVGTNSRGGKTSVYVETDHTRTTTSP